MLRSHQRFLHQSILLLDVLIIWWSVWFARAPWVDAELRAGSDLGVAAVLHQPLIVCLAWLIVSMRTGFYRARHCDSLGRGFLALLETWLVAMSAGALIVHVTWSGPQFQPAIAFLAGLSGICVLRLVVRLLFRRLRERGWDVRNVLLVGRGVAAHKTAEAVANNPRHGINIVGAFRLPGESGPLPDGVKCMGYTSGFAEAIDSQEIDSVLVCPDTDACSEDTKRILDRCDLAGIQCHYAPDFLGLKNLTASSGVFGEVPTVAFRSRLGSPVQLGIKRAMDIVGASIGIALCLPLLVGVAIAIKLHDGGPLFYRQIRLGKCGRRFFCYKFRSMCIDAEQQQPTLEDQNQQNGPAFKIENDPRITRVGRVLRKYSLDELPQLFNVLKGDMSLVGPRPPIPSEVAQYSWWQRRRISIRPGLTCLWQVKGRNRVSFDKWMEMDLFYIDNWSLWMDVKLMVLTMPALVLGTGM